MKTRRDELERAGWRIGETKDFLDLSDAEMAIIDMRVSLARALKRQRLMKKLSQETFAKRIGSSQSRVAKMERGDPSVSLDLLIRSLLRLGSTKAAIGRLIATAG